MKWKLVRSAFIAALAVGVLIYASMIETTRLTITRVSIDDARLHAVLAGRKIALLGDLHFSESGSTLREPILKRLAEIRPDLVILIGDFVRWGSDRKAYDQAFAFLRELQAPLGVYAVLGDADSSNSRASCEFCHEPGSGAPTRRHAVVFLRNDSRVVEAPGGRLRIAGIDLHFPRPGGQRLRKLLAGETPTILVSHVSDVYGEIDPSQEVLTVAGDTHGGQIRLPRWFWRLTGLMPDPEHIHGFYRDGRKSLFVTRGIGTSRVRFRFGSPPEIAVLEISGSGR